MLFCLLSLSLLFHLASPGMVKVKEWYNNAAHQSLITSVAIFNDNTKFVTGSKDNKTKVWSMETHELLFTKTYTDYVTYVGVHPVDNRIFVVVFNRIIEVLDPNNYSSLTSFQYPGGGNNGNFLQFFSSNSKFVVSGYQGSSSPILHIYNANTYAPIAGGPTTIFDPYDQVTGLAISKDQQLLGVISNQEEPYVTPPFKFSLYNMGTNTLFQTFQDNYELLKWIIFNPNKDQFYVTSNDLTLKAYRLNSRISKYQIAYSYPTSMYGFPNCVAAKKQNEIVFVANSTIIFLDISGVYPQVKFTSSDETDIFVFEISPDGKHLITGMKNGQMTLWQIGDPAPTKDEDLTLLIILGGSIGGFIMLAIASIIIYKCCCLNKNAVKDSNLQKNAPTSNEKYSRKNIMNKTQLSIAQYQNMENSLQLR